MQLTILNDENVAYFVKFFPIAGDVRDVEIERHSFKLVLEFNRDADLDYIVKCIHLEIDFKI
ncbi:MAG: hypothetical protein ACRC0G_08950 [Fusobacteriaceae bacterium]